MSKKTYRTYFLKSLCLHLKDADGERVVISFRGGIQVDSTARYTTRDPEIQAMLETSSGFGRDFYIESEREDEPVAPVEEKVEAAAPKTEKVIMEEVKGSERFRNLVEMKNRMAELGIELEEGANYQKAKAVSAKAGYDFQINRK